MPSDVLPIAILSQVFPDPPAWERLPEALAEGRQAGAELALLPEIPLNDWVPGSKVVRDEDAEEEDGPRQSALARAAREAGIAVLGGAIVRAPGTGSRHSVALLYDASGLCIARYRKVHLPEEEGYWETYHYEPGGDPPPLVTALGLSVGIQVCSDVNRTTGFQLLAAMGADVVLVPRCTPPESYERWKLVLRAGAVTSACYVVSANRPASPQQKLIGGPSLAIAPDGSVLLETTAPLAVVELRKAVVEAARAEYPGYLKMFPDLYARGWQCVQARGPQEG